VLHRTPDDAGLAYWQQLLDTRQTTVEEVLHNLSEGKENTEAVTQLIGNGIVYTVSQIVG
jgi:hypothetical protein